MLTFLLVLGVCLALSMTAEATYRRDSGKVDHTASGAVTAGEVLQLPDGRAGIALADIADTKVGSLHTQGHFDVAAATGTTFSAGDTVYWDVSASLAIAAASADISTDFPIGVAIVAKASGPLIVRVDLNQGVDADAATFAALALEDGANLVLGTSTGSKIGTATGQKLAFHNATPVIQRAGAAQAAVVGTGATNSTPYGYSQAQADAIVTLLNEIRAALVEKGIIKGSA